MYSFLYEESETWAVWPSDVSLSTFAKDSSDLVVKQIFRQLFDGVRDDMNRLKHDLQNVNWQLTTSMNELLASFDSYLTSTQVDETFARYGISSGSFKYCSAFLLHTCPENKTF